MAEVQEARAALEQARAVVQQQQQAPSVPPIGPNPDVSGLDAPREEVAQ
jgi:hypothetical protein